MEYTISYMWGERQMKNFKNDIIKNEYEFLMYPDYKLLINTNKHNNEKTIKIFSLYKISVMFSIPLGSTLFMQNTYAMFFYTI